MQLSGLQFDHVPALNVPFRFFFTAIFFAICSGGLLIFYGEKIWLGRWLPINLALTHSLGLGVMALIMFGSMFQILPVLCGAAIALTGKRLWLFHLLISLGIGLLVVSFLGVNAFLGAALCLLFAFLLFLLSVFPALIFFASGKSTRLPMLLALICLLTTVMLGLVMVLHYFPMNWQIPLPDALSNAYFAKNLTNAHASFALFGWVVLLVMAVGFQVIPMFHVCETLPLKWQTFLPVALFSSLVTLALFINTNNAAAVSLNVLLSCSIIITFAVSTLFQLAKRKRKLPDTTVYFWQLGFTCLIVSLLLLLSRNAVADIWTHKLDVLLAGLFAIGFVLSIMQGMLLKIVPFLITLHLQRHVMNYPMNMGLLPDFYSLISRKQGRILFYLQLACLLSFTLSAFIPQLTRVCGLFFIIQWTLLGFAIGKAAHKYKTIYHQMML